MISRFTRPRESRYDASMIIGMQSPRAWLFATVAFAGIAVVGGTAGHVTNPALYVLAMIVLAACAAVLLTAPGDPVSWPATLLIVVGPPSALAIALPGLAAHPGLAVGTLSGLPVIIAAFLCVRGRVLAAWVSNLLVAAVSVFANLYFTPQSAFVEVIGPNVAVMVMGTVFALIVRPRARQIYLLRQQIERESAAQAADEATLTVRDQQLALLDERTRPLLELIAARGEIDDETVRLCRLVEAQLRDRIRAPGLDVPDLVEAVWDARGRGVRVLLLDDRDERARRAGDAQGGDARDGDARDGDVPEAGGVAALDGIVAAALPELRAASVGNEVTVRLLPGGRSAVATIAVADGEHTRRIEFGPDGRAMSASR